MNARLVSATITLTLSTMAQANDGDIIERLHPTQVVHVTQSELNAMLGSDPRGTFIFAFEIGDELFEVDFTFPDGGGANVGNGERTTRMPRADLDGPGAWASHTPARATGPNGSSCISCHLLPVADGAGGSAADVHRDPLHTGDISRMIHRNTPHLHGMGAIQRLAEEMTEELQAQRDAAIALSESRGGAPVEVDLESKGVGFGRIVVRTRSGGRWDRDAGADVDSGRADERRASMARPMRHERSGRPRPGGSRIDYRGLEGIDEDLVVKPFQWKGTFPTVRAFNLDAMHNELGVQPREIVPDGVDGDGDGVHTETTIGDMTALTVYLVADTDSL